MSEDTDVQIMNSLANAFGAAVAEALHASVAAAQELAPSVAEKVVIGAAINGGMMGVMQYMSDEADAGRLSDPDLKVSLLFTLAADIWTQIRGGPASNGSALQ